MITKPWVYRPLHLEYMLIGKTAMPKKCIKEFTIEIEETLTRKIPVVAKDYQSALEAVKEGYDSEDIVLDSDDFVEVNFRNVSPERSPLRLT